MKRKPRWTLEMLTASLAVLCGLLLLVLLVQRPTAWLLLAVLVVLWGIGATLFRCKLRRWVVRWTSGTTFEKSKVQFSLEPLSQPAALLSGETVLWYNTAFRQRLLGGEVCALVTDAGTPAISDPGQELVALCAENGVTVQAIPGCCAAIAALAVSGLDTRRFTFEGFLPSGKKERRAALEELTGEARTMVFHEAPHRLRQTLADMVELLGDRPAALCRELTKLHEDTVRTTLAQAAAFYRDNEPRGEYVLVIAGREKQNLPALTLEEGAARVLALRDGGMKLKEAVRRVADDTGLPRNALYDTALKA